MVTIPHHQTLHLSDWKSICEIAKNIAETLGFVCAGIFFVQKWRSGYLVSNLSVSLTCERATISGDSDSLVIMASLEKGDRNTILLHDMRGKISYGNVTRDFNFPEIERRSMKAVKDPHRQTILWGKRSKVPFLTVSPGEKTQFATHVEVPKGAICKVDIAILGNKPSSGKFGQWRASYVSLPLAALKDKGPSSIESSKPAQ